LRRYGKTTNFCVWIFYELPHLNSAVYHASFYPCAVDHACRAPESWGISWFTAMFMHGSWDHILGNMLFLAIFGKNVEDAFGHARYLAFYIVGGFVAFMTQTAMTLLFAPAAAALVPNLGASGAIAAVMGAYFVLYPTSKVLTLVLVFPVRIPAWIFLGVWFLYQLVEGNFGMFSSHANGGGVAFFAHVGGFLFGVIVASVLAYAGKVGAGRRVTGAGPVLTSCRALTAPPSSAAEMSQSAGLTVAVTGATGELGKPFVRALERTAEVARVRAMARRPLDPSQLGWSKTEYRQGDILDRAAVDRFVDGADVVAHLAFIVVKASARSYEINIEGSRNVFEAAAAGGVRRLVYTSSLAAYGYHASKAPLTEDTPARGTERHAYSRQKAEVERVMRQALTGTAIDGYVFRPCIVAGPDAPALVDVLLNDVVPYLRLERAVPDWVLRPLQAVPG
jgi:membrane associated rhomboid family serine protease/uncharacterized protein YbjT (DUF2867 family)